MLKLDTFPGNPGTRTVMDYNGSYIVTYGNHRKLATIYPGMKSGWFVVTEDGERRWFKKRENARYWIRDNADLEPVNVPIITGRMDYKKNIWIIVQNVIPPIESDEPLICCIDKEGEVHWLPFRKAFNWSQLQSGSLLRMKARANRLFGHDNWMMKCGRMLPGQHRFVSRKEYKLSQKRVKK